MDVMLVVKIIIGLLVVLGLLVLLLVSKPKKEQPKKKKAVIKKKEVEKFTFEELFKMVRDENAPLEQLELAVESLLYHYPVIPAKMGVRIHDEYYIYAQFFICVVTHKNATKDLVLKLDKELHRRNPSYKNELNKTLRNALDVRS